MGIGNFLIYYIGELFSTFLMIYSFSRITNQKIKFNPKKIIFIIIITFGLLINNLSNLISLRYLMFIIIFFVLNKIIFKNNIRYTFSNTMICVITYTVIELLLSSIFLSKFSNVEELNANSILKILFTFVDCFLLLIIFSINSFIKLINKIKYNVNFYTICMIIILFFNILIVYRGISLNSMTTIFLSIICTIFIIITFKVIINDKYNIRILEDKNKHLKETYDAYSNTIDEYKEFKHNLKNELYSLKVALPEEYQPIVNKIILKYNKETDWINRIDKMPQGIQGILYLKIQEASYKKVKIIVNTKIFTKFENSNFLDLSNVIGILIDNAIDASSLTKNKIIVVNIEENKSFINIKMINKFVNSIDLNQIGKKNYSTKVYKSGLGLNSLKKLKSNNLKIKFNIVNDLFITNILCKK